MKGNNINRNSDRIQLDFVSTDLYFLRNWCKIIIIITIYWIAGPIVKGSRGKWTLFHQHLYRYSGARISDISRSNYERDDRYVQVNSLFNIVATPTPQTADIKCTVAISRWFLLPQLATRTRGIANVYPHWKWNGGRKLSWSRSNAIMPVSNYHGCHRCFLKFAVPN